MWNLIGSPDFPVDPDVLRKRGEDTFARGVSASGVLRQMLAIVTQPNRTLALRTLRVPTLVIHGLADKMVHVSGGRATASAVPGAELLLVDGMGHDLPGRPLRHLRRGHPAHGRPPVHRGLTPSAPALRIERRGRPGPGSPGSLLAPASRRRGSAG